MPQNVTDVQNTVERRETQDLFDAELPESLVLL